MLNVKRQVQTLTVQNSQEFDSAWTESSTPLVLKGIAANWKLVQAGQRSAQDAIDYLKSFHTNQTVGAFLGAPDIRGRYFYNAELNGFNFVKQKVPFDQVLERLSNHLEDTNPPSIYVGSTTLDNCLPGLRVDNDLPLDHLSPLASIWVGNASRIACHYDAPKNIACNAVGSRRVTLFPPQAIEYLYPGPLEFTPAGQVISMVDFANPDLQVHPKFELALEQAQVALLEPGDAIFIPSMWWHHVEGLNSFNVLINYWWRDVPAFTGKGMDALQHAMLSLRDLPQEQKQAWKALFEFYVFGDQARATEHLPESARGLLNPLDDTSSRRLRSLLLNNLNR